MENMRKNSSPAILFHQVAIDERKNEHEEKARPNSVFAATLRIPYEDV